MITTSVNPDRVRSSVATLRSAGLDDIADCLEEIARRAENRHVDPGQTCVYCEVKLDAENWDGWLTFPGEAPVCDDCMVQS